MNRRFAAFLLILIFLPVSLEAKLSVGTTFSKRQCDYLGIDWKETYGKILDAGFDIIRLGAYWEEIEREEGVYDFSLLDWQLARAKEKNTPVLLTVGMKAPRWPEFFIPDWVLTQAGIRYGQDVARSQYLRKKTLQFVKRTVLRYRDEEIIEAWQVENEPLDRSGANWWWINSLFLKEETILVRELDTRGRPIVINVATFPNLFLRRVRDFFRGNHPYLESLQIADIWGLNIYPAIGHRWWRFNYYFWTSPKQRSAYFKRVLALAEEYGKEIWVTELQAEPWEPGHLVYLHERRPPTSSPAATAASFHELRAWGLETIFLWGAEYWEFRRQVHEDRIWWQTVKDILKLRKHA